MSDNNTKTIAEALDALDIAFRKLSEVIKQTVNNYVSTEKRLMLLKTTSENSLVKSQEVLTLVSETLDVSKDLLLCKNRTRHVVDARNIYCFLVKKVAKIEISFVDLGKILNKDHATVLHACRKTEDLVFADKEFEIKLKKCIEAYNRVFTHN